MMIDLAKYGLYLFVGLMILLGIIALLRKAMRPEGGGAEAPAYRARGSLLSKAEANFVRVLELALPEHLAWQAKVRMSDVIEPIPGDRSTWQTAFNRITSKHLDLVLIRSTDMMIVAAIELDDRSHVREDRTRRDLFVDQAFAGAGVPLLRFAAKRAYAPEEIRVEIDGALREQRDSGSLDGADASGS